MLKANEAPLLTANEALLKLFKDILKTGAYTTVRNKLTIELLGHQTSIDMKRPIASVRGLGVKFLAAEAHWILTGQNKVDSIAPWSNRIKEFSDEGYFFRGAYGPKIVDQLPYVLRMLSMGNTRQAVINIWRERPEESKDIPCTLSLQWMIRDDKLHCFDTMRSSDAWLGWSYDVFNVSMLTHYIAALLREIHNLDVEPGMLTLTAASQHIYSSDVEKVEAVLERPKVLLAADKELNIVIGNRDSSYSLLRNLDNLRLSASHISDYAILGSGAQE